MTIITVKMYMNVFIVINTGNTVNTVNTINTGKPVNIVLPINTVTVIGIYCFYWANNIIKTIILFLLL